MKYSQLNYNDNKTTKLITLANYTVKQLEEMEEKGKFTCSGENVRLLCVWYIILKMVAEPVILRRQMIMPILKPVNSRLRIIKHIYLCLRRPEDFLQVDRLTML